MAYEVHRGEIWMYTYAAPDKKRPVLVLTRPALIQVLTYVTVAYITSTIRGVDVEVVIGADEGLKHDSSINLTNLITVSKASLRQYVGSVSPEKMRKVCEALIVAVGCLAAG